MKYTSKKSAEELERFKTELQQREHLKQWADGMEETAEAIRQNAEIHRFFSKEIKEHGIEVLILPYDFRLFGLYTLLVIVDPKQDNAIVGMFMTYLDYELNKKGQAKLGLVTKLDQYNYPAETFFQEGVEDCVSMLIGGVSVGLLAAGGKPPKDIPPERIPLFITQDMISLDGLYDRLNPELNND